MSEVMIYDAIVVGAGVEGSATAYQLAKRGRRVLLLEQFKLGHDKGSSHSLTRITRKAYGTQDFFTVMMDDAYRRTDELQTECGEQLFINTGCMIIGRKGDDFVEGTEDSLKRHNVPYERFDQIHSKQRLPSLCFPDNYDFIIDRSGGVLRADRILRAFQVGFQKYGGIIHDEEEMLNIRHGVEIVVQTNKETYRTKSLVLTLGPWASAWLPRIGLYLPLKPMRVLVCYWKEKNPGEFSYENFPTFIDITADLTKDKFCVYGLPSYERPGYVKICLDGGPPVNPDTFTHDDTGYIVEALCEYVTKHFPTLENKPSFVEPCYHCVKAYSRVYRKLRLTVRKISLVVVNKLMGLLHVPRLTELFHRMYDILDNSWYFFPKYCPNRPESELVTTTAKLTTLQNTPDEAYILDNHPLWRNVVIGAGFSGQGFKLAPVVGCILADLAEGRTPEYEMEHFRIDRFNTNT